MYMSHVYSRYEEWKILSEPQLSDSVVEGEKSHDTFSGYHESAMQIFSTIRYIIIGPGSRLSQSNTVTKFRV